VSSTKLKPWQRAVVIVCALSMYVSGVAAFAIGIHRDMWWLVPPGVITAMIGIFWTYCGAFRDTF
jgi:hypothetical protein